MLQLLQVSFSAGRWNIVAISSSPQQRDSRSVISLLPFPVWWWFRGSVQRDGRSHRQSDLWFSTFVFKVLFIVFVSKDRLDFFKKLKQDYLQVHFHHVLDFRRGIVLCCFLYKQKEDKLSSVASIVWTCWMWICSFYRFRCTVFTFQTELMMKREEKRRRNGWNLQQVTPPSPSVFPYILPSFIFSSFFGPVWFMLTHIYLLTSKHAGNDHYLLHFSTELPFSGFY